MQDCNRAIAQLVQSRSRAVAQLCSRAQFAPASVNDSLSVGERGHEG